jgi:hypothetical protein
MRRQLEWIFSLLSAGPFGIIAFIVIMIIILWALSWVIGLLSGVFSFMGLVASAFLFLMVWLLWGALDDYHRQRWGMYLWILPFAVLGIGLIGKQAKWIDSLELSIARMNTPLRFQMPLGVAPLSLEVGSVTFMFLIVTLVLVTGIAILFRDELTS